MKAQKFLTLISVLAFSLAASSVFAVEVEGIDDNDHAALTQHYENVAKKTEAKLQKTKLHSKITKCTLITMVDKVRISNRIQSLISANTRKYWQKALIMRIYTKNNNGS